MERSKLFCQLSKVNFYNNYFRADLYSVNIDEKVREDIDKYKQIGTAKKQLYSMPQYFREKERKGIKLPANKVNGQSVDKGAIKIRGQLICYKNKRN